ncbi:MAG TPA: ABC transporter substrate-binding protein [Clostridiaceae bacterium]|jgi:hypothetical protein|nr:ABC transporter substrate-binding protein [Clostridiaceae bacterium]
MKERIYTIPINEAFDQDSECPLCICETKLEDDALRYFVGPAMMEPDCRIETNRTGFCAEHFNKLYNLQKDRLPLALVIDTHLTEQIEKLGNIYKKHEKSLKSMYERGVFEALSETIKGKNSAAGKAIDEIVGKLKELKNTCAVCDKMGNNMDKLIDNTLFLYKKEPEFKKKFLNSKGFCLKHLEALLEKAREEFSPAAQAEFVVDLFTLELKELSRVQEDVNYFTKMFDYRNAGADWKNSRDAVPRSIEKIAGAMGLKR